MKYQLDRIYVEVHVDIFSQLILKNECAVSYPN